MVENQDQKHAYYTKVAWSIYALISIVLMLILVLVVASDNEEMFFYGIMTPSAFYVFRPTNRYINKLIYKFTGVTNEKEQE
ncbi:MAG: hypothetical protein OEW89_06885 [Gammaproteobacteria bacterium]|nr:hypothetical protein [Gammaproteobacteria bacterium]MDH5594247.1 hypothetical protein [Gammaproteobacteria bacterium]MDH5614892.1 hypothetical protein [Gammaproteobacteria bacterium]